MREIYKAGVTPQQKIVAINNKFGNTGVKNQQGTTRIMYDTLPVVTGTGGTTNFRFFEDSSSRTFPLSNTGSEGNKLGVGDTMVIAQILFSVIEYNPGSGTWVSQTPLTASSNNNNLAFVNVEIANNQVIKRLTLSESEIEFNKDTTGLSNTIDLETSIVLPPLLPYVVELQLPTPINATSGNSYFVECQIIGVGGIIAPRTTF
jgi:hypothetical protein